LDFAGPVVGNSVSLLVICWKETYRLCGVHGDRLRQKHVSEY